MSNTKPHLRTLQRDGWCRVCDYRLERNVTKCVSWYSTANRGQFIHICVPCVNAIHKLANEGCVE